MTWIDEAPSLLLVVGSGGVGKTTVAAGAGLRLAEAGHETLVMTFDPSLRLKDTLGVGAAALDQPVAVARSGPGAPLWASLLDARTTFDRLVRTYSQDSATRDCILGNRYYHHLAGGLAGILEYMAVERLFEVYEEGQYQRIVLDTPPTSQALDFLEAPQRIVDFLDSGALRVAMKPWFDDRGRLRASRIPGLGRGLEAWLDRLVGIDLLRDMADFFRAFQPLFDGFRQRALQVQKLLRSKATQFVLVTGPDEARIPDALFFARRLAEGGYPLGPVVINRVHPEYPGQPPWNSDDGASILAWQGARDQRGVAALRSLLGATQTVVLPQLEVEPADLTGLAEISRRL